MNTPDLIRRLRLRAGSKPATRPARIVRRCSQAAGILIPTVLVGCAIGYLTLTLMGYKVMVEVSGSMEPVIHTGSLVVIGPATVSRVHPGDVIAFDKPGPSHEVILHRLIRVSVRDGHLIWITKGDANDAPDRWPWGRQMLTGAILPQHIGVFDWSIPYAGYPVVWVAAALGPNGMLLVASFATLLIVLHLIWRSDTTTPSDANDAPAADTDGNGASPSS